jgi:hypothetical protein
VVRPKDYTHVIADGVDDVWGMDLADMGEWHESNDGNKYILVVVDALSRYAWCKPLKTKNAKQVWDAFKAVMDEGGKPNSIWVDKGTEFYNAIWTAKLKALDVDRYSTFGEYKVSLAERFIRTVKNRIWFRFIRDNTRKWIDALDEIVKGYNKTIHSATRMSPNGARKNEGALLDRIKEPPDGDPKYRLPPDWSYEIFQVVGIRKNVPVMYELNDYYGEHIEGAFNKNELQPVADKTFFPVEKVLKQRTYKGRKEKCVKFLGYKERRWMPAEGVSDLRIAGTRKSVNVQLLRLNSGVQSLPGSCLLSSFGALGLRA